MRQFQRPDHINDGFQRGGKLIERRAFDLFRDGFGQRHRIFAQRGGDGRIAGCGGMVSAALYIWIGRFHGHEYLSLSIHHLKLRAAKPPGKPPRSPSGW